MASNKPPIAILLATYNPNIKWFKELLNSLNKQDYPNLFLFVLDDCSEPEKYKEVVNNVEEIITSFKYIISQNKENLGSNKTFEKLIQEAEGFEYLSLCDQDDIWEVNKISKSFEFLCKSQTKMIYSDAKVINEDSKVVSNSVQKYRKRFTFEHENKFKDLIYRNFVIGCTVLISRDLAIQALPFSPSMVHDHQLAIEAAHQNQLVYLNEPLINYRIHSNNQTLVLGKVNDRESYYEHNILKYLNWAKFLNTKYKEVEVSNALTWAEARVDNYNKIKSARKILKKYGKKNKNTTRFELYVLNNKLLFKFVLKLLKKNII